MPGDASGTICVWTLCKFGQYNICLDLKLPRDETPDRQALLSEPGARITLGRVFDKASLALLIPPSPNGVRHEWLLRSVVPSTEIIGYPQLARKDLWYDAAWENLIELQCTPALKYNVIGWHPHNVIIKQRETSPLQHHA